MKNIVCILLLVVLSGCSYDIKPEHYEEATRVCSTNEGLRSIRIIWDEGRQNIVCNNGAVFSRTSSDYSQK